MLPPPCQGGIVVENRLLAVDDADARRREHLVPGEHEEVGVERLHVGAHVRHRLRAVDEHQRAVAMGDGDHLARRRHRAERVRDLRQRDDARLRPEQLLVFVEHHVAAVVDRRDAQLRAGLEAELLPGHDIGVVLEPGDDDLVARLHIAPAPALRDEVDPLGRAAHEHDLFRRSGVEEAPHLVARRLVGVGRAGGQRMRAAVHVGVLVRVEGGEAVDHGLRLLRGRAVVEPDQPLAVHLLLQDREVVADRSGVEGPRSGCRAGEDRRDRQRRRAG